MRMQLKKLRKQKGYTQSDLALLIGTTTKHVSDLETGRCGCSFEIAYKISKHLNYDIDPTNLMLCVYDGINRLAIDKVKQIASTFNVRFDESNLFGEG